MPLSLNATRPQAQPAPSARRAETSDEESDGGSDAASIEFDVPVTQDWAQLTAEQQAAAAVLRWTASIWATTAQDNCRVIDRGWSDLSAVERAACEALEIEVDDWDYLETQRSRAGGEPAPERSPRGAKAAQRVAARVDVCMTQAELLAWQRGMVEVIIQHHETFRITIHPPYSSTKG